ncbi:hypothetical protein CSA80_04320 [Candidatus Saccharibacteria bacterium]|nr:MAG: hypothetical protein CR973_01605 [Candidatus Saccharibacteria bacterium]PID98895.1 MAG: hypothetical protein CSA80_04320 [Candidatus Saccharibacteria bacterium]
MKQKDIAVIVAVALLSAIISFILSTRLFVTPENRQQEVEVVDVITADFEKPNSDYFNEESINPTQNSQLNSTNPTPFKATEQ